MHRRHCVAALAGAFPVVSGLPARLAQSANVRQWRAVQSLMGEYVRSGKLAGAVTAVSYSGGPLANLTAGRIALDSPVPFDENSICRIYSMSKPVIGIAAMTLIEEGKLGLDHPVSDVIPEWRTLRVAMTPRASLESRPATKAMTMRHLLTHTSGLAYWTPLSGADALPSAYRERGCSRSYRSRPRVVQRACNT